MWTLPLTKNGLRKNKSENSNDNHSLIELRNVVKNYKTAVGDFPALKGVDLDIQGGEFVSVIGKSGSGKTTLINMIAGIDRPTDGEVWVNGTAVHKLNENQMARWRGRNLGIVFQFFQLLPMLSLVENIMLPMDFCNTFPAREREARALHLLEQMELADHAYKLPSAISAANNSVWLSRVRWPTIPPLSWPMNQPATLIPKLPKRSSKCSTNLSLKERPSSL